LENRKADEELRDEDIRDALKEVGGNVDVTLDDLKKIFTAARRLAKERVSTRIPVSSVMSKTVISVTKDVDIVTAAGILSENRISGMPVIDKNKQVLGVVSEGDILSAAGMGEHNKFKDILRRILGEPIPKSQTTSTVKESMSSPAITVRPDVDVSEAACIMSEKRIKRLPVVDDKNQLLGIISRADIVRLIGKH